LFDPGATPGLALERTGGIGGQLGEFSKAGNESAILRRIRDPCITITFVAGELAQATVPINATNENGATRISDVICKSISLTLVSALLQNAGQQGPGFCSLLILILLSLSMVHFLQLPEARKVSRSS
jgi:hypothetical protein